MIFQKATIHHVPVLLVRYVTYINEILNKDIMITLCNPQGELHFDWFDKKDEEEIINPVFLNNNDLDEVSELLKAFWECREDTIKIELIHYFPFYLVMDPNSVYNRYSFIWSNLESINRAF